MKKGWRLPLGLLLGSLGIVFAEIGRELHSFCIRHYKVSTTKLKRKVRFVFLSDLHGKMYGTDHAALLEAVKRQKPDFILAGGDMLTRTEKATDRIAEALLWKLRDIAPVYIVNGNHEQKMKERPDIYGSRYQQYKAHLEQKGITVLENQSLQVTVRGECLTITGLEVPTECYGHLKYVPVSVEEIQKRIGRATKDHYQILMAHTPAYMQAYKDWGADLTLCGHLHGGIIRLPFIGGVITPQVELFPRYSGDMYKEGEQYSIVSRGLGTHTVNLRYRNMAELVTVTLIPAKCPHR